MTYEAFQAEVETAIATLTAIAQNSCAGFGDGYRTTGVNISIAACEAAAEITGANITFCKMLNHGFRAAAAQMNDEEGGGIGRPFRSFPDRRDEMIQHSPGPCAGLPLTDGQWVADRDRAGDIMGWLEMFPDCRGRLFSIPDASRYIRVTPQ